MAWYCKECKKNVGIIIDTYDIHVEKEDADQTSDLAQLVRDLVEWEVICAECEGPVVWRDCSGKEIS